MLRISRISGKELTITLEEDLVPDVKGLKQNLNQRHGFPPRFRQRLLFTASVWRTQPPCTLAWSWSSSCWPSSPTHPLMKCNSSRLLPALVILTRYVHETKHNSADHIVNRSCRLEGLIDVSSIWQSSLISGRILSEAPRGPR